MSLVFYIYYTILPKAKERKKAVKEYLLSEQEVCTEQKTHPERGLSSKEAAWRLEKNGRNKLEEGKKTSLFVRFLLQLKDPMILILLIAAAVSAVTEYFEAVAAGAGFVPADALIILAVVLLNAVLGVVQESKAEAAIEALQKMSASKSKVIRDGKLIFIDSQELVVGDILVLEAGDALPADGRLLECASLQVEEAALTGESVPVNKALGALGLSRKLENVPLGDRTNMVYSGSTVVYGRGKAVVTACGMDTEMGKIAGAISAAADDQTPLQKKLGQLSKTLSFLVLGISLFIFIYKLAAFFLLGASAEGQILTHILEAFMVAVSLAVAAIPEGLVAVVTVVLSIGVTNMSKKNAIIRKMTAVETLGCAQIICSDKTGTLTQNKMTVVDACNGENGLLARAMALCSDAEWEGTEAVGEPTECALVAYAAGLGLPKDDLKKDYPRVGEAPFDSDRKRMSTLHQREGKVVQYTKGAPDELLKRCDRMVEGGVVRPLTEEDKAAILSQNKAYADRALRVLGAAYTEYEALPEDCSPEALERDLIFIGLVGMIDPVRPEVKIAIEECKAAGIRAVMITGDHKDTAVAIGKELGILSSARGAITGAELDAISEEDFEREVENYSVYARVGPEHKVRIVSAWKKKGKITAMTGDGVNDAPSIKKADIGVGMGITGTDVTKNVADMVLADDNFATIVSAVNEGRRIYDNIKKSVQFLLSSNISEVISVFVATVLNFTILEAPHLLWINLVTDSLPAIALGMEKAEKDVMKRPPRDPKEGLFAGGMAFEVVLHGLLVSLLTLAAFFIGERIELGHWQFMGIVDAHDGMTMAFLTMSMCEIFHAFNMRSRRASSVGMLFTGRHNPLLYGALIGSFLLTAAVLYIPVLRDLFGFAPISLLEFAIALGLALLIVPMVELTKWIGRRAEKKKKK